MYKLNNEQQNEITSKYETGRYSMRWLAKKYNVSTNTIARVLGKFDPKKYNDKKLQLARIKKNDLQKQCELHLEYIELLKAEIKDLKFKNEELVNELKKYQDNEN